MYPEPARNSQWEKSQIPTLKTVRTHAKNFTEFSINQDRAQARSGFIFYSKKKFSL